ncbi:hypothetical protein BTN50_1479 [Candidatus Enterovibrio altilux]|uniref:Mobile element protein n=1 Tax=Candidatus Enterovibrio altilux TaxID=1927128 RepID=A0A291BAD8_9GAMM|nr:hypothetical protein BTN50_1479 [Candidatus Enterovibrio luxaltus]
MHKRAEAMNVTFKTKNKRSKQHLAINFTGLKIYGKKHEK